MVQALGARFHQIHGTNSMKLYHRSNVSCLARLDRGTKVPLLNSSSRLGPVLQSKDGLHSGSVRMESDGDSCCKNRMIHMAPTCLATMSLLFSALPAHASVDINTVIPGLVGDSPFREGLISAFFLIFFSEIGDKTFFIALLLALQRPKSAVFTGTFGALAVMTVISVGLGRVLHEIDDLFPDIGVPLDDILAVALLVFFGIQTLASASEADETAEEEKEEAQEVVAGLQGDSKVFGLILSTFVLVFAAEWGDKSFLATIALAAASDPLGVIGGAVTGHGVATVIAVVGGSFLGKYLSEKTVQYIGGSLFLVFAAATLLDIYRGV
jgi:putative Ca2+/H+ antiporter (TMEM165/GDT1 family)